MIKLRGAVVSDARAIANVHVASWQAIYRGHIPNNILDNLSIAEREKTWKELLENNVSVVILEEDNNLVGFISFCASRDQDANSEVVAEISSLYLNPDNWRKGFGRILCNAAIDELRKTGYNEVTLWVLDDNQQAKQFYEKMGFIGSFDVKADKKDGYTLRENRYRRIL
jgi:L-amino acid N-acyltransferase YncA